MTLTAAGDLGIGTSSPGSYSSRLVAVSQAGGAAQSLDAPSGTNTALNWYYNGTAKWTTQVLTTGEFRFFDFTASATRLTIDASGNLGLGVTPSAWVSATGFDFSAVASLEGSSTQSIISANQYNANGTRIYKTTAAATFYRQTTGQHQWFNAPSGTAGNAISFTQAMTLDASGNLLIGGTTTPSGGKANNFVNLGGSGGFWTKSGGVGYFGTFDNYAMVFATNDTERARITSGGDLLVGTTTYGGGANVAGAGLNPVGQIAVERDGGAAGVFNRFSSDGNLVLFRRQGTTVGSIDVTTTATAYVTSSDYRLKNITGLITNSGAYIDSLKPVEGTWKADGSVFVGLIAHEVQESSRTRIATGTKDGEEMQGIDYSASEIIANLIAELQSLRARVAQLEAK
jgi:hypothetical protein